MKTHIKHTKTDYPFGMVMPGRSVSLSGYRFGFNGKENDNEAKGVGNSIDFGARIYDSRLNRWLSLDPLATKYPNFSAYLYVGNNPIFFVDPDGKRILAFNKKDKEQTLSFLSTEYGANLFKFKENDLQFNQKKFNKAVKLGLLNSNDIKQINDIKIIINDPKIIEVVIVEDASVVTARDVDVKKLPNDKETYRTLNASVLVEGLFFQLNNVNSSGEDRGLLIINKQKANEGSFSSEIYIPLRGDQNITSNQFISIPNLTTSSASSNFIHELLDHGFDFITKGSIDDSQKTQEQKVANQNVSLEKKGSLPRDGADHE